MSSIAAKRRESFVATGTSSKQHFRENVEMLNMSLIQQKTMGDDQNITAMFRESPILLDIPHIPLDGVSSSKVYDISSSQMAIQLTLMSAAWFRAIKRKELESMSWTSAQKLQSAPSIAKITQQFNILSLWVAQKILESSKIKKRMQLLVYFINLAQECFKLNNFDGVKSIISGLQSTPIHRLSRTWSLLGRRERELFSKLEHLISMNNNSKTYRQTIVRCKAPFIPFLGIYMSDLTYIYECMKKDKDHPDRKEQYKERKAQFEQVIDEVMKIQRECFYDKSADMLEQASIEYDLSLLGIDFNFVADRQYQISFLIEPKDGTTFNEESDLKLNSLRIFKDKKIGTSVADKPESISGRNSTYQYESSGSFSSKKSKLRPKNQSELFAPLGKTTELPIDDDVSIREKNKPASFIGGILSGFKKRLLGDHNVPNVSQSRSSSRGSSINDFHVSESNALKPLRMNKKSGDFDDGFSSSIPTVAQSYTLEDIKSVQSSMSAIQTNVPIIETIVQPTPQTNEDPTPWDKKGKKGTLHLQGFLYKKEEFDEEGNAINGTWQRYYFSLHGHTLSITCPSTKDPGELIKKIDSKSTIDLLSSKKSLGKLGHSLSRGSSLDAGYPITRNSLSHDQSFYNSKRDVTIEPITDSKEEQCPTECLTIDHLCRVSHLSDYKKKHVMRCMLHKQRSLLLRAETETEMQLWLEALHISIGHVLFPIT